MKLTVVKIGGNVIDNATACQAFLASFANLKTAKILIHGGGKIATQTAAKLNITTQMIDGRRITDQDMLDVVTMVYGGLVNKNLVANLQKLSCNALGLTGADAAIIKAHKRPVKDIDYGFVGDLDEISSDSLNVFLNANLVPIIAPLSYDYQNGSMLNTNADTIASAVAIVLADSFDVNLVYCFEKKGVLSNPDDDESVIKTLNPTNYEHHKQNGIINKGMIPKLDNAFAALQKGVKQVTICHANDLLEAVETQTAGTVLGI